MLQDHGYNATPAWGILGGLLARSGPATDARIGALAAVDSLLLLVMWGFVVWAFGWRAAAVAALFWGTSYAARFYWTGGAFLRMDWLFCLVGGICLLKKRRPGTAGALLVFSALLRVFPALVLVTLGAAALARRKRPDAFGRRFVFGGAAVLAVALPLSLLVAGGGAPRGNAWGDFARNARKHLATPLTNNMGLTTLVSYRPETRAARMRDDSAVDPFVRWKDARRDAAAGARPFAFALALLALVVVAWRFRERPSWLVAAAAVGLVPFATDLTCYYHACLIAVALLAAERDGVGLAVLLYAAVSCLIPRVLPWDEDRYAVLTAMELALVAGAWWLTARRTKATTSEGKSDGEAGEGGEHRPHVLVRDRLADPLDEELRHHRRRDASAEDRVGRERRRSARRANGAHPHRDHAREPEGRRRDPALNRQGKKGVVLMAENRLPAARETPEGARAEAPSGPRALRHQLERGLPGVVETVVEGEHLSPPERLHDRGVQGGVRVEEELFVVRDLQEARAARPEERDDEKSSGAEGREPLALGRDEDPEHADQHHGRQPADARVRERDGAQDEGERGCPG
jgi:hypothetical protein